MRIPRLVALSFVVVAAANLSFAEQLHVSDGLFGGGEWNGPGVAKLPGSGTAGGAVLYAELWGTGNTLYLLYDYYAASSPTAYFDVFFEVIPNGESYVIRIGKDGSITLYEKPIGATSPLNADGSLDMSSGVWSPVLPGSDEYLLDNIHVNLTYGTSANSDLIHPILEFDMTVDSCGKSGLAPDIVTVDQACSSEFFEAGSSFWRGSEPGGGGDPPNGPGGNTVDPSVTPTPEPATEALMLAGIAAVVWKARKRRA